MHKIKTFFISLLMVTTTFSLTGCGGGEADYSFDAILDAFSKDLVTGSIEFDVPNHYVVQAGERDVTVIQADTTSGDQFDIVGGEDGALFVIDSSTGKLSFVDLSIARTNAYIVVVGITRKDELSTFSMTVDVVADIKTIAPIIDYVATKIDVVLSGKTLTQIKARPADSTSTLTFSLDDNKSLFLINGLGEITLIEPLPDFTALSEKMFNLNVTVEDGYGNITNVGPIEITLVENADFIRPIIETSEVSVIENSLGTTQIQVKALGNGTINQYILDGIDKTYFTLSSTGVLAFKEANDYEDNKNTFSITVQVGDDLGNLSEVQTIVVNVSDLDETFVFQGDSDYTPMQGTKFVGTVVATPKLEALDLPPQYSLVQGGTVLEIDTDGNIQFTNTAVKGQVVTVQVRVSSELRGSETLSKVFTITVQDDPNQIQPTVSYESTVEQTAAVNEAISVTTVTAVPQGSAKSISNYTIEGIDKDMFIIDNVGDIFFNNGSGSYARQDANQDNQYEIYVVVVDNNGNSNQTGTIVITLSVDETVSFDSIANIDVDESEIVTIQLSATSAQLYDITFSVTSNSSPSDVGISFDQITGKMFVKGIDYHSFFGDNTHEITVKAKDIHGNSSARSFIVTVHR